MPALSVAALSLGACSKGSADRPDTTVEVPIEEPSAEDLPDTIAFSETPVGKNGRLRVEGKHIVNEHGEAVQLRGVSSMWLNWESTGYALNYGGLQWMRDNWGVSVIRAAMGVKDGDREPAQGGYLTSAEVMERRVESIVSNASRLGVYVIIDWHDHFAQDSVEEAKDFFGRMAAQYADHPNVIYEIFNEPVPGTRAGDGPFTWAEHFKPYHEEVSAAIRAEDDQGIIVLGTPFWSQNVDEAAADPVSGHNLMYTVHFYSCTHDAWLRDKAQVAIDAGLAIFVTEWGATDASGGVNDDRVCAEEADLWHEFMDTHGISWAAWKLDDCAEISCLFRAGAPRTGGWDDWLQGHGPYVVERLRAEPWTLPDGEVLGGAGPDAGVSGPGGTDASAPDTPASSADAGAPAAEGDAAAPVFGDAAAPVFGDAAAPVFGDAAAPLLPDAAVLDASARDAAGP